MSCTLRADKVVTQTQRCIYLSLLSVEAQHVLVFHSYYQLENHPGIKRQEALCLEIMSLKG